MLHADCLKYISADWQQGISWKSIMAEEKIICGCEVSCFAERILGET